MLPIIAALLAGATPTPALSCPTPTADRGEIRSGPPLTQTFRLTNTSASPGTIASIETGCGCVGKQLSRERLGPGESSDVTLTINTLTQPAGPNTWRGVVRYKTTDDSEVRQLELIVRATLVREVSVMPAELAFSTTGTARQTLTVTDRRAKPLTVVRAVSNGSGLAVEVRPAATANGTQMQSVVVSVSDSATVGDWSEAVTLVTDDPTIPEMRIPVTVSKRVADAAMAVPSQISLRFAPGQTTLSGVVQLRAGGKTVAIRTAAADHPAVRVTPSPPGPVAVVRIAVDAAGGRTGSASVKVDLAEPAGQTVTIPVSWEAP